MKRGKKFTVKERIKKEIHSMKCERAKQTKVSKNLQKTRITENVKNIEAWYIRNQGNRKVLH